VHLTRVQYTAYLLTYFDNKQLLLVFFSCYCCILFNGTFLQGPQNKLLGVVTAGHFAVGHCYFLNFIMYLVCVIALMPEKLF